MATEFTTRSLDPGEYAQWEEFVAHSPDGGVYSSPAYLRVLGDTVGGRVDVIACFRDREIIGGLALLEHSSLAGRFVAPRLLGYYNGLVFAAPSSRYPSQNTSRDLKIAEQIETELRRRGYASIRLHSRETVTDLRTFRSRGWQWRPSYSYVLDFSDLAAARERVEGNFRRLVRRCEAGDFALTRDDGFDEFYALHREIHERKGAPLYLPKDRFERYYEALREVGIGRLYHARDASGRAVASQLVLADGHPVTHSVCAGAAEDALQSGASVFLRWKVAEALSEEGYRANDLTDAELNPVTRFKSQLGADLKVSFVVEAPASAAWQWHSRGQRGIRFARRVAGFARRRLLSRG